MKTLGKIAGGIGLLALLTSPLTLLVTSGSRVHAGAKAVVGLVLLVIYFVTNRDAWGRSAESERIAQSRFRGGFFWTSSMLMGGIAVAFVAALNVVAAKRAPMWDLTKEKIYSLSAQSLTVLEKLPTPVRALVFLPANDPRYETIDASLRRFSQASEKFTYEIKDPFKAPDLAKKYQVKEGEVAVVLLKGTDAEETRKGLQGVSEQDITNGLIALTAVGTTQKAYYVLGHGEFSLEAPETRPGSKDDGASLTNAAEFKRALTTEGYAPTVLNTVDTPKIPSDAAMVIIAAPRSKFTEAEKKAFADYLEAGGRLIYFAEAGGDASLEPLLMKYGIQIDPGLVVDVRNNPSEPYLVPSVFYSDHEITKLLKSEQMAVHFPTVAGLSILKEGVLPGVSAMPIVLSSPWAWEESKPSEHPTLDSGEKSGSIPLVAVSSRDTNAAENRRFEEARVVVFGDAQVIVDALWGQETNRNLVLNALGWATTQAEKITIRPPDRDVSTLDIDDAMLTRLRFLAADVLPLLLAGVGLAIWLLRKNR